MRTTILLVEDSATVQRLYRAKLQAEGFEVVPASSGMEALHVLTWATPDLILLDLVLPDVAGLRVLEVVRSEERLKQVPVIVISARDHDSELQRARALGISDFVLKSTTTPNELVHRIRICLNERKVPMAGGRFRLRVEPSALDAPRLAKALDVLGLRCATCGRQMDLVVRYGALTRASSLIARFECAECGPGVGRRDHGLEALKPAGPPRSVAVASSLASDSDR